MKIAHSSRSAAAALAILAKGIGIEAASAEWLWAENATGRPITFTEIADGIAAQPRPVCLSVDRVGGRAQVTTRAGDPHPPFGATSRTIARVAHTMSPAELLVIVAGKTAVQLDKAGATDLAEQFQFGSLWQVSLVNDAPPRIVAHVVGDSISGEFPFSATSDA